MLAKGVIRYKPAHYRGIASWYTARGLQAPPQHYLSDLGFIADGRVAGWLYLTNSNVALIEGIISNPNTVPSMRRQALKKLSGLLVDTALSMGYTVIKMESNHPRIQELAEDLGFKEHKIKTFILHDSDETEEKLDDHSVYSTLFKEDRDEE